MANPNCREWPANISVWDSDGNKIMDKIFRYLQIPKAIMGLDTETHECPRCGCDDIFPNPDLPEPDRMTAWFFCQDCDYKFNLKDYDELKEKELKMTKDEQIDCMVKRTVRKIEEKQNEKIDIEKWIGFSLIS